MKEYQSAQPRMYKLEVSLGNDMYKIKRMRDKSMTKLVEKVCNGKAWFIGRIGNKGIYLRKPVFECNWYWNRLHLDNSMGYSDWGDMFKQINDERKSACGEYIHHFNEIPELTATVLTDKESWELADLLKSYEALCRTAEIYFTGGSHLASSKKLSLKNKCAYDKIVSDAIPSIIARVGEILSPNKEQERLKIELKEAEQRLSDVRDAITTIQAEQKEIAKIISAKRKAIDDITDNDDTEF